jgi:hypothetical protein
MVGGKITVLLLLEQLPGFQTSGRENMLGRTQVNILDRAAFYYFSAK